MTYARVICHLLIAALLHSQISWASSSCASQFSAEERFLQSKRSAFEVLDHFGSEPSRDRTNLSKEEAFYWTTNPRQTGSESTQRLAFLRARLEGRYDSELVSLRLKTSKTATRPKLNLKKLGFVPNLAGIGMLGFSLALLFTESWRTGVFLLSVMIAPAAVQVAYLSTREPEPYLLESSKIDSELREMGRFMKRGDRLHIGLNTQTETVYPRTDVDRKMQQLVGEPIKNQTMDTTSFDLWSFGFGYKIPLVRALRSTVLASLEEKYGKGNVTFDLLVEKLQWGRMQVEILVTMPKGE